MLGLALLTVLVTGLVARHLVQTSELQATAAELAAVNSRNAVLQLQSEEQDIRAKIAAYLALRARGIVGAERRMDWVELMRSIQRERKLLGLEYEIQPRQPWPGNNAGGTGYRFMSSVVRVQIPLLHEGDLMRFLGDVQTEAAAFVHLRNCKLQRNAAAGAQNSGALAANLNAECQMDWVTLMPEGESQ
jgi:hypothetical protein